jgi:hypothetical protein
MTLMAGALAERGWHLEVAFEIKFALAVLVDGSYVPIDSSLCSSTCRVSAN